MKTDLKSIDDAAEVSQWITVTLHGGPRHGQAVRVPDDEFLLVLHHHGEPHRYIRLNNLPVFRCENAITRLLGGKR